MSENPSTLTSIDAYDLFVDPQFLASHPKNSFTLASAKRAYQRRRRGTRAKIGSDGARLFRIRVPDGVVGAPRGPRTALWDSGEHVLLGDHVILPGVPQGTRFPTGDGNW